VKAVKYYRFHGQLDYRSLSKGRPKDASRDETPRRADRGRLQTSATVPMIDVRAYSRFLIG
jgi:hypothetical protein